MNYDSNYNADYCSTCGSTGGCDCCGGHEYSACSPDYNPVTVNNSTCPNVDGSTGTGGSSTSSGNSSTINVSVEGNGDGDNDDCCCKNGVKKLLDYLYNRSLDVAPNNQTSSICIYGNIIPDDIETDIACTGSSLLSIDTNPKIQITTITNDIVRAGILGTVSLCSISIIKFKFQLAEADGVNEDANLRKEFFYTQKCKCCCDCGNGVGQALYLNGLGAKYTITIQDTLNGAVIKQGTLGDNQDQVTLIAVDNDIAVFSSLIGTTTVYYGVPTCRIAKFIQ